MRAQSNTQDPVVLSYLDLRRAIGCIGIALPFVLVGGKIFFESPGILGSISGYYYSVMRNVFVGSLCTVAIFLLSYRGYGWQDRVAGTLACFFAIAVALCPTAPIENVTQQEAILSWFHLFFGAGFFSMLAFFALVLFRRTDQTKKPTKRKQQRNAIYLLCGIIIVLCIALIGLTQILNIPWIQDLNPIFWLESFAIVAFGISWFVKGETILRDEGHRRAVVATMPHQGLAD